MEKKIKNGKEEKTVDALQKVIESLKQDNKNLEAENEKFKEDRRLLDDVLQKRAILQRGDYISTKLGPPSIESKTGTDEKADLSSLDPKLVIAEVVARESDVLYQDIILAEHKEDIKTNKPLFVKDFDSVLLDAGSTTERIAQQLFEYRKYLTILTNNMGAWANFCGTTAKSLDELLAELYETIKRGAEPKRFGTRQKISEIQTKNELVLTGGRYAQMYDSLLGDQTIKAFESFSPGVVIIGTSGIIANEGLFCHGGEESNVKEHLWKTKTSKRIIATSSDKIGKRDSHMFGDIQKSKSYIDEGGETILITDRNRYDDSEYQKEYTELKKYLHIIEVAVESEQKNKGLIANLYSSKIKNNKPIKQIVLEHKEA